jgi:hypothetical protein
MKCILLFIWLLPSALYSQSIRIREIKFKPKPKYYNTADSTIIYPIIVTGNPVVNRLINKEIKEQVLDPENSKATTRETIRSMIRMGLTDLSYEVTYSENGILSLKIDIEVMAAYPSVSFRYLNFDIRTGQRLEIKDIINEKMFEQFKSKVFADKIDSLKSYKENELRSQLLNKELDTLTYQGAMELVDSYCIKSVNIETFSLSPKGIEIIDECEFPHVIRGMEPTYELKYSYWFMRPYLRPEFQDRLSK